MSFGKLTKLKYVDLKGNPLQPALQKIIGPCLSNRDCMDAAKRVVPYYADLEKKLEVEKRKKAEKEEKEKELEAQRQREEKRLAKKAARKERVMLERQKKAEEEELLQEDDNNDGKSFSSQKETTKNNQKLANQSKPSYLRILKIIKAFLLISVLFTLIIGLAMKILPKYNYGGILEFIPDTQKRVIRNAFNGIEKSIGNIFKKY